MSSKQRWVDHVNVERRAIATKPLSRFVIGCSKIVPMLLLTACMGGSDSVTVDEVPQELTLEFDLFQSSVNPIFDTTLNGKTCSSSGCHNINGGTGGSLKLYSGAALDSAEMMVNFLSAVGLANLTNPAQSKLLLEPKAGATSLTGSHAGGDIFLDTTDANYQIILNWIASPVTP